MLIDEEPDPRMTDGMPSARSKIRNFTDVRPGVLARQLHHLPLAPSREAPHTHILLNQSNTAVSSRFIPICFVSHSRVIH